MPEQKQLKAGLEGLVRDGATSRSLVENRPGAPSTSFSKTGKPASPSKTGDAGSTCKFNSNQ